MYFTILDILRFLSSIAVVFHHTFLFHYGRLGIYLFFMISGFVIYFSLQKGMKDYIVGRFLRLYPLFWVCASITFLVTLIYGVNISFKQYLIGLLMFNNGHMETMIDGSYWTLTFELLFYFYIAVFVWLFKKERLEWFYVSWLAIALISFYYTLDQHIIFKLLSVRFAPYFVFGGMLALAIDRFKTSTLSHRILYGATLFVAALSPMYVSDRLLAQKETITNFTGSFDTGELIIVEALFLVMVFGVFLSYCSFAKVKTFAKVAFYLGGITYPLYLLHWKIGRTILGEYGIYGQVTYQSVLFVVILIALSFVLSVYEIPIRKMLKKKFF